jgi:cell division transport system ATP-binding protein
MIRFEHVEKRYPTGRAALTDLNLSISVGELAFLTGPSGAGKSTALKLLGLLERPTRGRITVGGTDLSKVDRRGTPHYRRGIGMVFQDHRLLNDRPVWENVALPLIVAGCPRRELDKRVRSVLDTVGLLGHEQQRPLELSTGEQQRVGIARALIGRPDVVIADEPTGNLDPNLALDIMSLFRSFAQSGVTVLVASHDLHLIEQLGARRIALEDGCVIGDSA